MRNLSNNTLATLLWVLFAIFINNDIHAQNSSYHNESLYSRSDSIKQALIYQISNYPTSQYRDVYKNFMQDFFGPGHLLNDTAASGKYLRYELNTTEVFDGPDYEPTGFQGNFYRVNLKLIKENIIPYDIFFDNFVESVQGINPPDGETWMEIWDEIDNEITGLNLHFENEEKDRHDLNTQFEAGDYIAHHSDIYNETVNFHYRIISREKFSNVILPLIKASTLSR